MPDSNGWKKTVGTFAAGATLAIAGGVVTGLLQWGSLSERVVNNSETSRANAREVVVLRERIVANERELQVSRDNLAANQAAMIGRLMAIESEIKGLRSDLDKMLGRESVRKP